MSIIMALKPKVFGGIYALILVFATLAGIECLSAFYAPSWPARALRSVPTTLAGGPFGVEPWTGYNSWGLRDVERKVAKRAGGAPRVVFVGDSFVESAFTPLSLPAVVEARIVAEGGTIEAYNLGVSGTDPRSYFYRIRDIALHLSPDVLLLFFYSGNDFVAPDQAYPPRWPALVDESPGASLLGSVMPRFNWLLVNRLRLSEFLRGKPAPTGENEILADLLRAPASQQMSRLVTHVRKHYHPQLSEQQIREVLVRGDGRLVATAEEKVSEQEYLTGWLLDSLVNIETGNFDVAKGPQDAARLAGGGEVEATQTWIEAAALLARQQKVPLLVFIAPVGSVDPDYAAFWKPWARYYAWNYLCDERHSGIVRALSTSNVHFVDLREVLRGIPGTYRKLDGHWSKKGQQIVADRVARELAVVEAVMRSERLMGGSAR